MPFDITSLKATRRAQTERKLDELNTLTPRQLSNLRRKRFTNSQHLAFYYAHVVELPNGCFGWTGNSKPASQGAYPMMPLDNGRCGHAVAWAYKHIRGQEPPTRGSGLELSHQCEDKGLGSRCANSAHVKTETREINLGRISEEKRKARMAKARSFKKCNIKKNSIG
ncbi:MAG TPA: hypothetical protein VHV29_06855 [Terriglobales bacterium]|jgi:hypothetical protein|nr:hypothetical protein [Terriglobales bacterium]